MQTSLNCKSDFLCVVSEFEIPDGRHGRALVREWYPVHPTDEVESRSLAGRAVTVIDSDQGIYIDEEGNVYQLMDKGKTKPIEVEHLAGTEKTELEGLLEASLNGTKGGGPNGAPKPLLRKNRGGSRKQLRLRVAPATSEPQGAQASPPVEPSAPTLTDAPIEDSVRLNLRQKLGEVRRRIGYIQKRGHNERFNYSYVTAADIAGSVGNILSELGVVVIPCLENITYESAAGRGETTRMARVVMAYTFSDVDSGEEIVAKVAGQGLDAGDKAPYKAMTGALKYALLQSFLLATGDDPEDERVDARFTAPGVDRLISADEVHELERLIGDTGTDLERVLAYYKVAALGEMTETSYQRAIEVLNRKLGNRRQRENVHAQD
jgi:translation elongation factor P/translation initiation factor 5A